MVISRFLTTTTGNLEVGVALVGVTTFNVRPMSSIFLQPRTRGCGGYYKVSYAQSSAEGVTRLYTNLVK